MSLPEFEEGLRSAWPGLGDQERGAIAQYRELVLRENQVQNLTRLLSPSDFLLGHVWDVRELLSLEWMDYPALDLGSGAGVPGLIAAIAEPHSEWTLTDSEARKAAFLQSAVDALGLSGRVSVYPGRAESLLRDAPHPTIVAKAVGTPQKILNLLSRCSTWNTCILFRGPAWKKEEKATLLGDPALRGTAKITAEHTYNVPHPEGQRERVLVRFERVPRGTKKTKIV